MTKVFTASAGTVMAITAPAGEGMFSILIDGKAWGPDVDGIAGIVSGMSLNADINVQFTQTLRDVIYLTVFGNKMGSMTISGMLFLNNPIVCRDGSPSGGAPLTPFFKKFKDYNAINRKEPIVIVLAGNTIKGFLLGFQMQVADAQFHVGQFTMQFAVIPGTENDAGGT
jgi:hypothetical protein